MALQELHESSSAPCVLRNGSCVMHDVPTACEISSLRGRIAQLEAALADNSRPSAQIIPLSRHDIAPVEIDPSCAPTMVPPRVAPPALPTTAAATPVQRAAAPEHISLQPTEATTQIADSSRSGSAGSSSAGSGSADTDEPDSEGNAFAAAWADDQSSFEERFAARQFFYDDGPESPSRKWLLG